MGKPRFRQEQLVAEPIDDQGGRFIDVMDPDTGNVFRFFEVEFSLACAMDGERDVAGIVKWAQEELGVSPSQAEVRTVIATLGELGYLDQTAEARAAAAAAPGRTAGHDQELAPGVVSGGGMNDRTIKTPAIDVELGHAGFRAAASTPEPKASEVTLGAPGATAAKPPVAPAEDVQLGASGRFDPEATVQSEVSLDLSDHIAVRPDDVKEAVRASKVMSTVDVPQDLLNALEEPPPERPVVEKRRPTPVPIPSSERPVAAKPPRAPTPVPMPVPVPVPQPQPQFEKAPVAPPVVTRPVAEKPAVELPKQPPVKPPIEKAKPVEKMPIAPPTTTGVSPILVVFLILAIVGAAVYFGWKYLIKSSNDDDTAQTSMVKQPVSVPPVKPPEPVKPPPPPPPAVKLAIDTPVPVEVKAITAGQIEAIDNAKLVKRDALVAKLAGNRALTAEIAAIGKEITRVEGNVAQGEKNLVAAKAANNAAKAAEAEQYISERKATIATKQGQLAAKQADLDKLLLKAPADGELKAAVKAGAKVAANDVVFSVIASPVLVATFKADGAPVADSFVFVAIKGTDKKLTCRVIQVNKDGVKVICPVDETLVGSEVTLAGAAPAPVPVEPPPPTPQPKRPAPPRPQPKPPEKPPEPKPPEPKPPEPKPEGSGSP